MAVGAEACGQAARPVGMLAAVLQLPCAQGSVSPSPYTSLRILEPVINLVAPETLAALAAEHGLHATRQHEYVLPNGKRFAVVWLERG